MLASLKLMLLPPMFRQLVRLLLQRSNLQRKEEKSFNESHGFAMMMKMMVLRHPLLSLILKEICLVILVSTLKIMFLILKTYDSMQTKVTAK
jgi:hypothetical protein